MANRRSPPAPPRTRIVHNFMTLLHGPVARTTDTASAEATAECKGNPPNCGNVREVPRMLSKCDNWSAPGLWSSGVPLRRDIPDSMPSPATVTGTNRFPAGRDGGTKFPRPFYGLGVKSIAPPSITGGCHRPGISNPNPTAHPAGMGEAINCVKKFHHRPSPRDSGPLNRAPGLGCNGQVTGPDAGPAGPRRCRCIRHCVWRRSSGARWRERPGHHRNH